MLLNDSLNVNSSCQVKCNRDAILYPVVTNNWLNLYIFFIIHKYILHNGNVMNDELGSMLMEVTVAYFKVIFQHLPGRDDENHKTIRIADYWVGN